jgi:hypothetical protein
MLHTARWVRIGRVWACTEMGSCIGSLLLSTYLDAGGPGQRQVVEMHFLLLLEPSFCSDLVNNLRSS